MCPGRRYTQEIADGCKGLAVFDQFVLFEEVLVVKLGFEVVLNLNRRFIKASCSTASARCLKLSKRLLTSATRTTLCEPAVSRGTQGIKKALQS